MDILFLKFIKTMVQKLFLNGGLIYSIQLYCIKITKKSVQSKTVF